MQDRLQVAIKQITLKSVPGKLSSIRQKEIAILKVCCFIYEGHVGVFPGTGETHYIDLVDVLIVTVFCVFFLFLLFFCP